jgi:type I restriction enzyme S subunit
LSIDTIKEIPLFLPDLPTQTAIAKILSSLDEKIELNNKINQELEAAAKELYDYWFVQFDFPNKNGKPYKSSGGRMIWNEKLKKEIPEDWSADNICRVATIGSGGTPSKREPKYWNGNIPFFGPTDYNNSVFQFDTQEYITEHGLANCSSALYKNGDIIITARGSIGKKIIVGTDMAMNQSCYALVPKSDCSEYLFFLTEYLIEALKLKGGGSVFKSIITSDIENTLMCIANDDVISKFSTVAKPIFAKIANNTQESVELAQLRDFLLPLLMNGQVKVW